MEVIKFKNILNCFNQILEDKKKLFALAIFGATLIILPNFFSYKKKAYISRESFENYEKKIQFEIENIISNIQGAGKAKIFITFVGSSQNVYATENKENKESTAEKYESNTIHKKKSEDCEKKYIITKESDGSEHPLELKKIYPKANGAVVICKGADNLEVRKKITEAISIALGINTNKICVTN
ncbi:MAG: hypothetical protein LBJ32_04070 [Oscillospiraceae bacterium]|nr:hypothetical protein [Oscillospiraceae bacterium]